MLSRQHRALNSPRREATINRALDRVRQKVAGVLEEVPADATALVWVTDFPMFEWCAAFIVRGSGADFGRLS